MTLTAVILRRVLILLFSLRKEQAHQAIFSFLTATIGERKKFVLRPADRDGGESGKCQLFFSPLSNQKTQTAERDRTRNDEDNYPNERLSPVF